MAEDKPGAGKEPPKVKVPKVGAPKLGAEKITAPKVNAPKLSAPKAPAPKINAPKLSGPKLNAPKMTPPKAAPPGFGGRKMGGRAPNQPRGRGRLQYGAAGAVGVLFPGAALVSGLGQHSGYYTDAASAAKAKRMAAQASALKQMQPLKSALVKRASQDDKSVKTPLLAEISKARSMAKSGLQQDRAQMKKILSPVSSQAKQKKAALKDVAKLRQKQALKAIQPTKSALVKQIKVDQMKIDKQALSPMLSEIKKARGIAKSGFKQDLAQAKKLASPYKQVASKDAASLKKMAALKKKAAAKALMPVRSSLVKDRRALTKDLSPLRSMIGKDLGGIRKEVGQVSKAVKQSKTLQAAKKQETGKVKALKRLVRYQNSPPQ